MVSRHCFELEWIAAIREKYPKTDPSIIEKTIYAFELLGLLAENGLDFIFKGGTSMLLHIDRPRRLSIDVDIISNAEETPFEKIISDSIFLRYELDVRMASEIPKSHHKYYYQSKVNKREDYILLDVVDSGNPYAKRIEANVRTDFFVPEKEITIQVPTHDSLLGDKLTAFAPNTIGVPYNKKKSMSIIKQLIDVDDLFMSLEEPDELIYSYQKVLEVENRFRDRQFTTDDVLSDTIETCFLITQIDLKKSIRNEKTEEIRKGIQQIASHLLIPKYSLPEAKISASRVAYLAAVIKNRRDTPGAFFKRYQPEQVESLREIDLTSPYQNLNRLHSALPEAFYYWYQVSLIEAAQN